LSIEECYGRLRYSLPLRIGHKACDGDFLSHKKAGREKNEKQCMFPVHEATPLADATCAREFQTATADVSQLGRAGTRPGGGRQSGPVGSAGFNRDSNMSAYEMQYRAKNMPFLGRNPQCGAVIGGASGQSGRQLLQ